MRREHRKTNKINDLKHRLRIARKDMKKSVRVVERLKEKVTTISGELKSALIEFKQSKLDIQSLILKLSKRDQQIWVLENDFLFSECTIDELLDYNEEKPTTNSINPQCCTDRHTDVDTALMSTKTGKHYSLSIRKLYYDLLANHVPASKVSSLVKSVIKCLCPHIDISKIQLPKEICTGYMRKKELLTVVMAQESYKICNDVSSKKPFQTVQLFININSLE